MCAQHGAMKQCVCKVCNAPFCPECIFVHAKQQHGIILDLEHVTEYVQEKRGELEDRQVTLGEIIQALRVKKRGVLEAATKLENSAKLHAECEAAVKRVRKIFAAEMGRRRELSQDIVKHADGMEKLIREYERGRSSEAKIIKVALGEDSMRDRCKVLAENMIELGKRNIGAEEEKVKKVLAEADSDIWKPKQSGGSLKELKKEFENIRMWTTRDMKARMELAKAVLDSSGGYMKKIYDEKTQEIRSAEQTLQIYAGKIKEMKTAYERMVRLEQELDGKAKNVSEISGQLKFVASINAQILSSAMKMKEDMNRATQETENKRRELAKLDSEIKEKQMTICKNGCRKLGCIACGMECCECKTYTCTKCARTCKKCGGGYCVKCNAKLAKCKICRGYSCFTCLKTCKRCELKVCMNCYRKCGECETELCAKCTKLCNGCAGVYCNDKCAKKLIECEECHKVYCAKCLKQCDKCRMKYCADCAIKLIECADCKKSYCVKCVRQCEKCYGKYCVDCASKFIGCEGCKKAYCAKCTGRCEKCNGKYCSACSSKFNPCQKCKKSYCNNKCTTSCKNCKQIYCEECYKFAKKVATCCGDCYCELCAMQCKKCTWKICKEYLPAIAQVMDNDLRVKFTASDSNVAVRGDVKFEQGIHCFEVVAHQFAPGCSTFGFGICDINVYRVNVTKNQMRDFVTGITTGGGCYCGTEGEVCKLEAGQPYLCVVNLSQQTLTITGKGVNVKAKLDAGKSYIPVLYNGCCQPAEMSAKLITKFE